MLNPARQIPVNSHPIVGVDQILIEKYASFQDSGMFLKFYLYTFIELNEY